MTIEGYFIIFIFATLILKLVLSQQKTYWLPSLKSQFSNSSFWLSALYFLITFTGSWFISDQIPGMMVIHAIMWIAIYIGLKSINYQILAWWMQMLYLLVLWATYLSFEQISFSEMWKISSIILLFAVLFILIIESLRHPFKIFKYLTHFILGGLNLLLITGPLTFIAYYYLFGVPLQEGQINAIYQTNPYESIEFIGMHGTLGIITGIIFIVLGTGFLTSKQANLSNTKVSGIKYFYLFSVALLLINMNHLSQTHLYEIVTTTRAKYQKELLEFQSELRKRKSGEIDFEASKEPAKELYVVIIGESLNKAHMGLYGYQRNTTPFFQKQYENGEVIKYTRAYANHVHTVPTLTFSLTEANQVNGKSFHNSLSIIDIQDKAKFDTYWVSNQIAIGGWDNPVSVLADRVDTRINLNNNLGKITATSVYDYEIVTKLEKILAEPLKKNTVIYIHLMGNHGAYKKRYPLEYDQFHGKLEKKTYGAKAYWSEHINEYDNSVLYNDFVVSQIVKTTQAHQGVSACIYFADHSEEVLNHKGHDQNHFNFSMIQTPMLLWLSEEYQNTYPIRSKNIKENSHKLFSNDLIYDFLIGLTGVKTTFYESNHDPSNFNYMLPNSQAYTLHNSLKITDRDNKFFHEKNNIQLLDSLNVLDKVIPHRINSLGSLSTVINQQVHGVELDVVFQPNDSASFFEVGHDQESMSGMSFEEYLAHTQGANFTKIWLDLKNLNQQNLDAIFSRLDTLNKVYALKDRLIFETTWTSSNLAKFSRAGFYTSYYIPTHYKELNIEIQKEKALEISQQIIAQEIAAISFDYALYPFVKELIEPLISSSVEYHTWNIGLNFQKHDLIPILNQQDYFNDTRVKTILIKYNNDFEI